MKVYIIQEYYDDVVCDKVHICIDDKKIRCNKPIKCSRRIHEITSDLLYAIKQTRNKPNWSYESFELK